MPKKKLALRAVLVMGTMLSGVAPAAAWAADAATVGEVVVTAQKRSENVKDVPIAITAVSGDTLNQAQIVNFHDLTRVVPSFNSVQLGDSRAAGMNLRGVSSIQGNPGRHSSLGMFVDGVFMARTGMGTSQDFLDVERVEVLRGPQGTLFGMNTAAGLIHVITRKPDLESFGGSGEVVFGDYDTLEARARITGPLVQGKVGFSLAASGSSRSGFTYNSTTQRDVDNEKKMSVRGKLMYRSENFEAVLSADYAKETTECCAAVIYKLLPGANLGGRPIEPIAPAGLAYSNTTIQSGMNTNPNKGGGVSAELNWSLGDFTLTSLTAVRSWQLTPVNDADALPYQYLDGFVIHQEHRQVSQELRIASPADKKLTYVAGLFFYDRLSTDFENIRLGADAPAALKVPGTDAATITDARVKDRTYAIFGHLDYNWTDKFTTSVGARYTKEPQEATFTQTSNNRVYANLGTTHESREDSEFSWKLDARYRWSPQVTTYASIARGFKPGGFEITRRSNMRNFQFEPETNLNYELGLKSTLLDRRLSLNVAAFYTVYSDFQTLAFDGVAYTTRNADEFVTKGIEIEAEARPTQGLSLSAAASFIDATYTDFKNGQCKPGITGVCDLSGQRLNGSAQFYFNGAVSYRHPISTALDGAVRLDYGYKSDIYISQNLDPNTHKGGYGVLNGRIGVESSEGLTVELFARNLLDKKYMNFMYGAPFSTGAYVGYVGAPRVVGVRASKRF